MDGRDWVPGIGRPLPPECGVRDTVSAQEILLSSSR